MKEIVRKLLFAIIPAKIQKVLTQEKIDLVHLEYRERYEYTELSYAQEGEDLFLERIFGDRTDGCFVDVGAHHPRRFSNTYKLYLKGWRGINIDPMPGIMNIFQRERPEDINLEIGISENEGYLPYYIFNEPALNTFSKSEAEKKRAIPGVDLIEEKKIPTFPLDLILDKYLDAGKKINVMSIDVEGFDIHVLKSNDWNKYCPEFILVEELESDIATIIKKSLVYSFLSSKGYLLFARFYNTSVYKAVNSVKA